MNVQGTSSFAACIVVLLIEEWMNFQEWAMKTVAQPGMSKLTVLIDQANVKLEPKYLELKAKWDLFYAAVRLSSTWLCDFASVLTPKLTTDEFVETCKVYIEEAKIRSIEYFKNVELPLLNLAERSKPYVDAAAERCCALTDVAKRMNGIFRMKAQHPMNRTYVAAGQDQDVARLERLSHEVLVSLLAEACAESDHMRRAAYRALAHHDLMHDPMPHSAGGTPASQEKAAVPIAKAEARVAELEEQLRQAQMQAAHSPSPAAPPTLPPQLTPLAHSQIRKYMLRAKPSIQPDLPLEDALDLFTEDDALDLLRSVLPTASTLDLRTLIHEAGGSTSKAYHEVCTPTPAVLVNVDEDEDLEDVVFDLWDVTPRPPSPPPRHLRGGLSTAEPEKDAASPEDAIEPLDAPTSPSSRNIGKEIGQAMSLVFVEAPMALFKSSAELIDGISGASQPATLDKLIERRAALAKAKEAGLSCGAAWAAGYSCADAKAVGYDLMDAKAAGWTTEELLNAGYINQALAMRLDAANKQEPAGQPAANLKEAKKGDKKKAHKKSPKP